jgi:flavin-dependent dehydrogenase
MTASNNIHKVVIVGGGSAGWLSAGVIASTLKRRGLGHISVTLVESPDISTIGVGEGTWPSMRSTLQSIGISETDFIRHCDAAFKQGTCFIGWQGLEPGGGEHRAEDCYLHPFTLPQNYHDRNPVNDWLAHRGSMRFSDAVSPQGRLAPLGLAPKAMTTPEYAFYLNYGYHLNAGKFADMLREHCVGRLDVEHRLGEVSALHCDESGYLSELELTDGSRLRGDFFVDCSGSRALLLEGHYGVPLKGCGDVLFNDTALAVQVPYADPEQPVASCTLSTAHDGGWIWDIGLSTRRGVGCVYSSAHCDDDSAAQALVRYLAESGAPETPTPRKISFTPGHREQFWSHNCVAVGMASGFIEPLEASALVLVELSARYIAEDFPVTRDMLPAAERRFNARFRKHWEMIIDFLKLHYVLSHRPGRYWEDHRDPASIPQTLQDRLSLWAHRPPWHQDAVAADDMFPPASYQYVLYGMGFHTENPGVPTSSDALLGEVQQMTSKLERALPSHRELLSKLREHRLPTI